MGGISSRRKGSSMNTSTAEESSSNENSCLRINQQPREASVMLSPARDRYITQTKNDNITHSNTKVNYSLVNKNKHPTSNCHSNLDAYMTETHQLTKESGTVHSISREASVLLSPARDRYISQSKNDNTTNTEKKVNKTLVSNNKRSINYK
jgi:hypothetical protein